jgi:predicted outer membrane protein
MARQTVMLACLLAATAGCRGRSPQAQAAVSGPTAAPVVILEAIHQFDQHHVTLGQLAQERAAAIALTDFGTELVRDHQAIDARVVELATARHLSLLVDTPEQQDRQRRHEAVADRLRVLDGPAFDRAFLPLVVQAHETFASLLATARQADNDQELAALLTSVADTVQRHLDAARRLAQRPPPAAPVQARRPRAR